MKGGAGGGYDPIGLGAARELRWREQIPKTIDMGIGTHGRGRLSPNSLTSKVVAHIIQSAIAHEGTPLNAVVAVGPESGHPPSSRSTRQSEGASGGPPGRGGPKRPSHQPGQSGVQLPPCAGRQPQGAPQGFRHGREPAPQPLAGRGRDEDLIETERGMGRWVAG